MFEYDEQKALRSEAPALINEPGAYVGTILQCEHVKAQNSDAEFVRFMFRTQDGVTAWLNIFTKKKDGTEAFGVGYIHALMGLLGVQSMEAVPAKCRAWNGEVVTVSVIQKSRTSASVSFSGMRDRRYEDSNGVERVAYDPQIVRTFDPATHKTLTETKKNFEAKTVYRDVEAQVKAFEELKAKIEAERADSFESAPRHRETTTQQRVNDLPEDIPF